MKEIITVGDAKYTAIKVSTGIDTISIVLSGLTEDEAKSIFGSAKSLSIGDGNEIYGEYPDVEFESLAISADDKITVTMHILTKAERQIKDLWKAVAEHDEAIAELLYGGGEA